MRDLTDDEKSELQRHCIFCKEPDFILASFAMNLAFDIYCVECRAGYKVTHATLPWQFEVLSSDSAYAGNIDFIFADSVLDIRPGHHYRVKVNNDTKNPRIVELVDELDRAPAPAVAASS